MYKNTEKPSLSGRRAKSWTRALSKSSPNCFSARGLFDCCAKLVWVLSLGQTGAPLELRICLDEKTEGIAGDPIGFLIRVCLPRLSNEKVLLMMSSINSQFNASFREKYMFVCSICRSRCFKFGHYACYTVRLRKFRGSCPVFQIKIKFNNSYLKVGLFG